MGDTVSLGERELDVMGVLWERGSGTVAEVQEALPVSLAYTTVLTILRNLEAKGYLRRDEEGRAHRYSPRVKQKTEQRRALRTLLDTLFSGSPQALLAHLVDDIELSAAELQRIAKQLANAKKEGDA